MATFLELVNSTRHECDSHTDLTTLTGLVGMELMFKNWVARAWMDVQRKHHNWNWMRSSFTFPTVAAQASYTPAQANATNFGAWIHGTFRTYVTVQGYSTEVDLERYEWEYFRNTYLYGSQRTMQGRPVVYSIQPDNAIALGPMSEAGHTITGDFYARAMPLVNAADVPALPDKFVDVIMFKAMVYYALHNAASEVLASGTDGYNRMLSELERDQLPEIYLG